MNVDTSATLAVALLCAFAVGISATTLESSLSTEPDDVITLDWDRLPISQDDAATIEREIQSQQESGDEKSSQPESGAESSSGSASNTDAGTQDRQHQEQQQDQSKNPERQPREPTFWEQLLALLRELLPWLVALGFLATLGALAYRYRERLRTLAVSVFGRAGARLGEREETDWLAGEPATEVDRMWVRVVRRIDPDDPTSTTVTELVEQATEAGLDSEGVRELARVLEEVRYGGRPLTEARRQRATAGYRKLGLEDDGRSRRRSQRGASP